MWMYRFVMHHDTSLDVGEPCRSIDRISFFGNNPVLAHGAICEIQNQSPIVLSRRGKREPTEILGHAWRGERCRRVIYHHEEMG